MLSREYLRAHSRGFWWLEALLRVHAQTDGRVRRVRGAAPPGAALARARHANACSSSAAATSSAKSDLALDVAVTRGRSCGGGSRRERNLECGSARKAAAAWPPGRWSHWRDSARSKSTAACLSGATPSIERATSRDILRGCGAMANVLSSPPSSEGPREPPVKGRASPEAAGEASRSTPAASAAAAPQGLTPRPRLRAARRAANGIVGPRRCCRGALPDRGEISPPLRLRESGEETNESDPRRWRCHSVRVSLRARKRCSRLAAWQVAQRGGAAHNGRGARGETREARRRRPAAA